MRMSNSANDYDDVLFAGANRHKSLLLFVSGDLNRIQTDGIGDVAYMTVIGPYISPKSSVSCFVLIRT